MGMEILFSKKKQEGVEFLELSRIIFKTIQILLEIRWDGHKWTPIIAQKETFIKIFLGN